MISSVKERKGKGREMKVERDKKEGGRNGIRNIIKITSVKQIESTGN